MRAMDLRRYAPAAARNRDPILEVLQTVFPEQGRVLEIASGTGEHAVHFARAFPGLTWQPTDLDPEDMKSIDAWRASEGLTNLLPSMRLDTREDPWPVDGPLDGIFCANMIHISPWASAEGLFSGAGRLVRGGGTLVTYGPYRIGGEHTAPSNEAFDASLKSRDPSWGVRDLGELEGLAGSAGLALERRVEMPANNFTLVWRRG